MKKIAPTIVAILAILLGVGIITLQTEWGQKKAAELVAPDGVTIEKLHFNLPFQITLENVSAKSGKADWIHASIMPTALVGGWVMVDELRVGPFELLETEGGDLQWPTLPVGIAITSFEFDKGKGSLLIEPFGGDFSGRLQFDNYQFALHGDAMTRDVFLTAKTPSYEKTFEEITINAFELHLFGRLDSWSAILSGKEGSPEQQLLGDFWVSMETEGESLPARLIGPKGFAEGVFSIDTTRTIRLKPISGQGRAFKLTGEAVANLDGAIETAVLLVDIEDLSILNPNLSGSLSLRTEAKGSLQNPHLTMTIVGQQLTAYEQPVQNLSGNITLDNWGKGELQLSGNIHALSLNASANYAYDECWDITNLEIKGGGSLITGELTYCETEGITAGNLSGDIASLAEWAPIIDIDLDGSINFTADLVPLHVEATSPYLLVGRYRMENNTLNLNEEINLSIETVRFNEQEFSNIVLETVMEGDFRLTADGIEATGSWDRQQVTFDSFEGDLFGERILLRAPLTIGKLPLKLNVDAGRGTLQALYDENTIQLQARAFPLRILEIILPQYPMTGELNGKVNLVNQEGEIHLRWEGVEMLDTLVVDLGEVSGSLEAELKGGRIRLGLQADSEKGSPLAIRYKGPLGKEGGVSGEASFSGEIAPILQFWLPDTLLIDGQVEAKLKLSGSVEDPNLSGEIRITEGTFEDFYTGLTLSNVEGTFVAQGHELVLGSATGNDGTPEGHVRASGVISLEPQNDFPFQIDIEGENVRLINLDVAQGRATGTASFHGTFAKPILSGDLTATDILINLEEDLPAMIPTLNVTYINIPPSQRAATPEEEIDVALNINLKVPDNGNVIGMGVKSLWAGELQILGDFDRPLLKGGFNLVKGIFEFSGKQFKLIHGNVTFDGSPEDTTNLDIVGQIKLSDATINANLKGTLPDLNLTFFSTPPLSDTQILSYLLFNGPTDALSATQGLQLAKLSTQVARGDYSPDPFSKVVKGIGLDQFSIKTGEGGDSDQVGIAATKRFHRNLEVSAYRTLNRTASPYAETPGRAIETPSHTSFEFKIFREFRVGVEFISETGSRFILVWQKDY